MHDDDTRPDPDRPDPEGVRIIGADEAERALERDDVARRRGPEDPRPGDRPGRPPEDAPEPVLRFPLSSSASEDPAPELPHWSEPPTGEYGAVEGSLFDEPAEGDAEPQAGWSAFSSSAPRWRDSGEEWSDEEDVRHFGDDDTRIGALDDSDRPDPEDFFSFDELDQPPPGRSVFEGSSPVVGEEYPADEVDYRIADDDYDYGDEPTAGYVDEDESGPRKIVVGGGRITPGDQRRTRTPAATVGGDRNIGQAAAVGVGFIVAAAVLFSMGPAWAMVLIVPVVTLAVAEFLGKLREVGYQPAVLLAVAGTAALVIGAYHRGEAAVALGIVLMVAFSLLWFLAGAGHGQATINIGATLLGFGWIGVFGSFAGALLGVQGGVGVGAAGKGILFGAILATVAYDIGGYFVGRSVGSSPLSEASPNKTVEGLLGGCIAALTVALIYGFLTEPFGSLGDALALGLTVAIVAPLGDLCESMVKRDLGIKDMGTILPGHGGLLDRFDALLFVLPAVYYVAKLSDFFV